MEQIVKHKSGQYTIRILQQVIYQFSHVHSAAGVKHADLSIMSDLLGLYKRVLTDNEILFWLLYPSNMITWQ